MFASSDAELIVSQSQLYAGLFVLVAAVCGLVMFLQTWLFNRAGTALTDRLRVMSFKNYLQQEQGWFDAPQNSVGALCARLATDCAAVQGATGQCLHNTDTNTNTTLYAQALRSPNIYLVTIKLLLNIFV